MINRQMTMAQRQLTVSALRYNINCTKAANKRLSSVDLLCCETQSAVSCVTSVQLPYVDVPRLHANA
jgi:hypothetical protein